MATDFLRDIFGHIVVQPAKVRPDHPLPAARQFEQRPLLSGEHSRERLAANARVRLSEKMIPVCTRYIEKVYVDPIVWDATVLLQQGRNLCGERSVVVLVDCANGVHTPHSTRVRRPSKAHAVMVVGDDDRDIRLGLREGFGHSGRCGFHESGLILKLDTDTHHQGWIAGESGRAGCHHLSVHRMPTAGDPTEGEAVRWGYERCEAEESPHKR